MATIIEQAAENLGGEILQFLLERFAADLQEIAAAPSREREPRIHKAGVELESVMQDHLGFSEEQARTFRVYYVGSLRVKLGRNEGPTLQ